MIYIVIVLLSAFSLAIIVMANEDDKYKDTPHTNNANYRVENNKISITLFFILLIFLAVSILYVIVSEIP